MWEEGVLCKRRSRFSLLRVCSWRVLRGGVLLRGVCFCAALRGCTSKGSLAVHSRCSCLSEHGSHESPACGGGEEILVG